MTASPRRSRVLVVDDEPLFRMTLADSVRSRLLDVEVLEAGDGREALETLDHGPIDALVTDLRMPGLDGIGLLEQLLRRGLRPPTLIVSAHCSEFPPGEGLLWFATKPVDPFLVCRHIERMLGEEPEASRPWVTRMGLVQAIASEGISCVIREASRCSTATAPDGEIAIVRGRIAVARASSNAIDAGEAKAGPQRGVGAAVEILSRDGPVEVDRRSQPGLSEEDPDLDIPLRHVLARASARRRSKRENEARGR